MTRKHVVALLVAASLGGATPAIAAAAGAPNATAPRAVVTKTCSGGYTHAVIGGAHKCLRRGQYCARAYRSTYRRYGFVCARDSRGVYRLR